MKIKDKIYRSADYLTGSILRFRTTILTKGKYTAIIEYLGNIRKYKSLTKKIKITIK